MVDRQYRCPVCGAPIEGEIRLAITDPISGQKMLSQMKAIVVNQNVEIIADNGVLYTVTIYDKPYRESWRDDIDG